MKNSAGGLSAVQVAGRDAGYEKIVGRVPIELSLDLVCPERDDH